MFDYEYRKETTPGRVCLEACGRKPTSCADQLAIAVRAAKDAQANA